MIVLGDLFDRRKYLNFVTAKMCRELFLERIESMKIETHIFVGNHDVYYKDTNEVNSLDEIVTGRYKYIKTYIEPCLIELDGTAIQLLPWINSSNHKKSHEVLRKSRAEIVMGHLELEGFELLEGIVCEHGDDPLAFNKFDMVLTGHFHKKQNKGNIHYLGALMEHTWADHKDPKGFHIFNLETRELEFIQNPHVIFKMIEYNDKDVKDMISEIDDFDFNSYQNCFVKIVCNNRDNPFAFDHMLDKLYKVTPNDISVVEDISVIAADDDVKDVDQTKDTLTLIKEYVESMPLSVDKKKMSKYMIDVYKEAISLEHVE